MHHKLQGAAVTHENAKAAQAAVSPKYASHRSMRCTGMKVESEQPPDVSYAPASDGRCDVMHGGWLGGNLCMWGVCD